MYAAFGILLIVGGVFGLRANVKEAKNKIAEGKHVFLVHVIQGLFLGSSGLYVAMNGFEFVLIAKQVSMLSQ